MGGWVAADMAQYLREIFEEQKEDLRSKLETHLEERLRELKRRPISKIPGPERSHKKGLTFQEFLHEK